MIYIYWEVIKLLNLKKKKFPFEMQSEWTLEDANLYVILY